MSPGKVKLDDLATPEGFARRYPDLINSQYQIRYWLRNRSINGLDACQAVIQRDGRLFLVKPRFLDWLLGGGS